MAVPNPVLYILARREIDSLNPGKLAAQACHAANMAQTFCTQTSPTPTKHQSALRELWREWAGDRGFGTTICLETPIDVLQKMADDVGNRLFNWDDNKPFVYGVVTDPSYPLRDGSVTHLFPLITCGFVFGDKDSIDVQSMTKQFKLYP